jgi:hypothetical protein
LAPGTIDREAILKILEKRTSVARQRQQEAAIRFKEILAEYPSSIPHPDGITRIQDAADSYRLAIEELRVTQSQMVVLLVHHVSPDDLEHLD